MFGEPTIWEFLKKLIIFVGGTGLIIWAMIYFLGETIQKIGIPTAIAVAVGVFYRQFHSNK